MFRRAILTSLCLLTLAACGDSGNGDLHVAYADSRENLLETGVRLSPGGQTLRAALQSGLVALNPEGEIVPALAESWIVTDDGRSYIFRLRDERWPDGSAMTAQSVRDLLARRLDQLDGTSLGLDLVQVDEVRAMAGRVIEIRLEGVQPALLQLLAQPELGLAPNGESTGAMTIDELVGKNSLRLSLRPPEQRGLPEEEDWADYARPLILRAEGIAEAAQMFDSGDIDILLGGTINGLPFVDVGPLSRGTVRLDPAIGLFGLHVRRARGPLADAGVREGIAMALDRPALLQAFSIGGWSPTTRIVPPGLPDDPGLIPERWEDTPIAELRSRAGGRVAAWRAGSGENTGEALYPVTIAMAQGPGFDRLLDRLSNQFRTIGLDLRRVEKATDADILLVDSVARYASPSWFLNQFNCSLKRGLCNSGADALVAQAASEPDPAERARLLAEAEAQMTISNIYIPFGPPLRWSLVRGNMEGFAINPWAFHPLPDLAQIPR